jgi:DnaJ-class molecular chaperone
MPRNSEPPPCGRCNGNGGIQAKKPKKEKDGSVSWYKTTVKCSTCNGTGKCS